MAEDKSDCSGSSALSEDGRHHNNNRLNQRNNSAGTAADSREEPDVAHVGNNGTILKRKKPIAAWRLAVMFACIGMGLFLSLLDATIVATMLVDISEDFEDFRTSSWVVLAYTLTEVGMLTTALNASLFFLASIEWRFTIKQGSPLPWRDCLMLSAERRLCVLRLPSFWLRQWDVLPRVASISSLASVLPRVLAAQACTPWP